MKDLFIMSRYELNRLDIVRKIREKRISVVKAATMSGISRVHMHRLLAAFDEDGPDALVSKKRGKPSNRSHSIEFRNTVMNLVREHYADFGLTLAAEKVLERHGLGSSKETMRRWMIDASLWETKTQKVKHVHQPRSRRECLTH